MTAFLSFKPYYKWITFNTLVKLYKERYVKGHRFKPYYKWITFNTSIETLNNIITADKF